ncbi:unnamed protein product [Aphanomyces euteiches]
MVKTAVPLGAMLAVTTAGSVDKLPVSVVNRMDSTADPCEDFYQYACGTWFKDTAMPASVGKLSTLTIMGNEANDVVKSIFDADEPQISALYKSCMDTDKLDVLGASPLDSSLRLIRNAQSKNDLLNAAASLSKYKIPMFATFVTAVDDKDPSVHSLFGRQVDLPLPEKNYYLDKTLWSNVEVDYSNYISTLFQLVGQSYDQAIIAAVKVIQFEKSTAGFEFSKLETMDAEASSSAYFAFSLSDASKRFPLTVGSKLSAYGYNTTAIAPINPGNRIVFYNLHYFDKMEALLNATSLETLRTIVEYKLLHASARSLSSDFEHAHWLFFERKLNGATKEQTRSSKCTKEVNALLGDVVGAYYLKKKWSTDASKLANDLVDALAKSMAYGIEKSDWLDDWTRTNALTKLSKVARLVGGPESRQNISIIAVDGEAFLSSKWKLELDANLANIYLMGTAVQRSKWRADVSPQTVNAYHTFAMNCITIPAGILQPPLFHPAADPAKNFGGVGVVIGHEITHGFDDHGRKYDADGKRVSWWSNKTALTFQHKAQCIVEQNGNFTVRSETTGSKIGNVDGQLTLGETIADNGGVKASFRAYKEYIKTHTSEYTNETGEKLFFLSFAQSWCAKYTDAGLQTQLLDKHPPGRFRVVGALQNNADFARVFNCRANTFMNPAKKCTLWE